MKIAEYRSEALVAIWHNRALAERCGATDIRELPDNHPDILAWIAAEQAAREADAADRKTLRGQIIGATEAQWLGLTDTQRQKVILKALKYVARNL